MLQSDIYHGLFEIFAFDKVIIVFVPQSVASDMRFKIFAQNDVKQNSKRQRVINSRYREDYIEPVIYRTIME